MSAKFTCRGEFVLKNCMCLPDEMDPSSKVCGYVNKQNGLVYPCDTGCCGGLCNKTVAGVRFHIDPSQYSETLPDGFNVNLPQSDEPSVVPRAAPFEPVPALAVVTMPVWQVFIFPGFLLILILISAFLA